MTNPPRRPRHSPVSPKRAAQRSATASAPSVVPTPSTLECFAVVAPGLELLALAEARALGLPADLAEGGGGISWRGELRDVMRANLGLRIASRVVVRLAHFEAKSFAELERQARKIAWSRVVAPDTTVRFRVTCKKSRLYHSDAVMQRVADAVVRALPGTVAEGASGSDDDDGGDAADATGHEQLIVVRIIRDQCTVSADTSGALLHRRGYRQATAKAPLRETIAAALLAASEWDGVAPLIDPFCGSGTIPIEAAMMARRMPPGGSRSFAVERWPGMSRARSLVERTALAAATLPRAPGRGSIGGVDRDAGAIVAARANAERAGVADDLTFAERSISGLVVPEGVRGWIVANPPYGVRVGDSDRVRDLWAQLGNVLRTRAPGWRVALLSPDQALERQLRLPMRLVAGTTNGGIPVRLIVGEVPAGGR